MQGAPGGLGNNSTAHVSPQVFRRFTKIPDNGWLGCVSIPRLDCVKSNGHLGSDVFLKLPSLDLAGDVEL